MKMDNPRAAFLLGTVLALAVVLALRENPGTARAGVIADTGTPPRLIVASTTGARNIESALIVADPARRTVAVYSVANNRFTLRAARAFASDLDIYDESGGGRALTVRDAWRRAQTDRGLSDMRNRGRPGAIGLVASPGRTAGVSAELYFYLVDFGSRNLAAYSMDNRNRIELRGARFFGHDTGLQDETDSSNRGISVPDARSRSSSSGPGRSARADDEEE